MAPPPPPQELCLSSSRKILILLLLTSFIFFTCFKVFISTTTTTSQIIQPQKNQFFGSRRFLLQVDDDEEHPIKKKKIITTSLSSKNQTKIKSQIKKLNSTSKSLNSAKNTTLLLDKSTDLSHKNKTITKTESKSPDGKQALNKKPIISKQTLPSWIEKEEEDDDDLVYGFTNLPSKFHETIMPDLERISKTSKVYLNKANKEITRGFKPYVGNKYAPTIASSLSFAFILIPLLVVSLIFNKIKTYFSIQKILIFIQVYLSIYFSVLCLSSLASGLEPLRFLYATSQSIYVSLQVLQTLAYVLYLLLLMMYLILVFSTDTELLTKLLGLGQSFVGFAVGLS